ncbi:MAG: uracil-DNA glycosylase [Ahrensia sp.]|nr:uracil-DNA glycosylase [Ahrensia sp.]
MSTEPVRLEELLAWYADAGVDVPLRDEPVNRFAEHEAKLKSIEKSRQAATRRQTSSAIPSPADRPPNLGVPSPQLAIPNTQAVEDAMALAAQASSLEELREAMLGFEGCNLKFGARSTVFADGSPLARLMIVGEGPGADEDAQGLPFVGRSGQLLDKMLAAIGLDRTKVYISNIIPWRPPGNRKPTPAETDICLPFIRRHIELAAPDTLLLLGNTPSQALLETSDGITRLRGAWKEVEAGERTIPALPSFHPAFLLRQPAQKRYAWRDLLNLSRRLQETADTQTKQT